jgi:hypothetical protein
MRGPSSRTRRFVVLAAGPLAVMIAAGMVWQGSYAAFSADTRNAGNNWSTGTVALNNDGAGTAMFQLTNIVPGNTGTHCIQVTSTSSVPGTVHLYMLNPITSAAGLETHMHLTVTSGSGATYAGGCAAFVADTSPTQPIINGATLTMAQAWTTYNSFGTGAGAWVTTGNTTGESKSYKFTWSMDNNLTQAQIDALQGAKIGVDFEWEIQNN